jgi:hypothetical protein
MIECEQGLEMLREIRSLPLQKKNQYGQWMQCLGEFIRIMKCEKFFQVLELNLLGHDLNSESYSFDSGSYMLQLIRDFVSKESLVFYNSNFIPLINDLKFARDASVTEPVKQKKYESLIQ